MFPKGRRTSGGWSLQFLCFDSRLFFSEPLRGLFSLSQQCSGAWLYTVSVLGFPTGPHTSSPVAFRGPGRPRGGELVAAVRPLPSVTGFDQVFFLYGGG